ncbi:MAG: hypothetical protein O7E52_22395 [Candidatus Poribacteria bacterium]|nr:hypothetical protein [Candidatus Poribacteria bacterium]
MPRYIAFACLFVIIWLNQADAATVVLRSAATKASKFSVSLNDEFEVEIFVDPQGQNVTAVSIYLSFDGVDTTENVPFQNQQSQFLELVDANFSLRGVQPVGRGDAVPDGWNIFESDTHGDPGNRFFRKFQIDFAQGLIQGVEPGLKAPGVVGLMRFRAIKTTGFTQITFDNDKSQSRVTEVKIGSLPPRPFVNMTPATISVVGGPVILDTFPRIIRFPVGKVHESLDLDLHVQDTNNTPEQLSWEASGNANVIVNINPTTHIVAFRAVEDWIGKETITFTARDPEGNATSRRLEVQVVSPPIIRSEGPIFLRVNETREVNLNGFVSDLDSPASEIQWVITRGTPFAGVEVIRREDQTILFIAAAQTPARTTVELRATDADGNSDVSELAIDIAPTFDGPMIDFSTLTILFPFANVIATNDGVLMRPPVFDLDDFVFDFNFEPADLTWTTKGNVEVQVGIDPETHQVTFRSEGGWTGRESVTFMATNPDRQASADKIQVILIDPSAPPVIADIPPIVLNFGLPETRDLKEYVFDFDSTPDQIEWEFSGNEVVQITIDSDRIATFFAEAIVSEEVTFTAIDPQSNRTSTQVHISVLAPSPPELRDFPSEIQVRHGEVTEGFDLDDFVTDATTPDSAIEWTASGFDETHLQVTIEADRRVLFAPQPNWPGGIETVTFTATNKAGLSASADTAVTAVFRPVVSLAGELTLDEGDQDGALDLDEHVEDGDTPDEEITWSVGEVAPLGVVIDPETRVVTIDAPAGSAGTHRLTFTATDPEGNTGSGTYTVNVIGEIRPPPKPPVVAGIPNVDFVKGEVDRSILLDDYVSDEDTPIDQIQWQATGNTNIDVNIKSATRRVTFATADFLGTEEITFTATDTDGLSDSQTIRVTVIERPPGKTPPVVAGIPAVSFVQGERDNTIDLDDHVTDADTPIDQIQWTVAGNSQIQVVIDSNTRRVTFTATDFVGTEETTFTATDMDGLSDSQTIRVTVTERPPGKKPPVVAGIPDVGFVQGGRDNSIDLDDHVTDEDTPINQIRWAFIGNAQIQVSIAPDTRQVTFTAVPDFVGTEEITFTATDADGLSGSQTIRVTVKTTNPNGEPPVIAELPHVIFIDGVPDRELDLDEFVADPDTPLNQLTWTVSETLNLTVEINAASHIVDILPHDNFVGSETITFTVTDPQQNRAEGTTVVEVRTPFSTTKRPVVSFQPVYLSDGEVLGMHLDEFVTDEDTPDAEIAWTAKASDKILIKIGLVTRVVRLSLKPQTKNFLGSELIALTATDPNGNSDTGSLEVIVRKPPDRTPPTFQVFALPNPIQPDFLTITITASEKLRTDPTLLVSQQPVGLESTDVMKWTGTHILPKPIGNTVVIIARGTDLAGNSGQRVKTLRFDQLLAAPIKPLTFLRLHTYPNPATVGEITLECQIDSPAILTVRVYNVRGELVKTINDDEFQAISDRLARIYRWNLADDLQTPLANGVYFCYTTARRNTVTKTHFWKMGIRR